MDKIYPDRLEFVNGSVPALNDTNLNKMSKALDDLDDRVIEVSGDIMTVVPEVREMLEEADALVESARVSASNASASEINAERYAHEAAAGSGGNVLEYISNKLKLKRGEEVLSEVTIQGGGGGGGTTNYNDLDNKPSINNVELIGNKSATEIGIVTQGNLDATKKDIYGSDFYSGSKSYEIGDTCIKENKLWQCIVACSGVNPLDDDGTYWQRVTLANFQRGVNTIYDAIVSRGLTPDANTPTAFDEKIRQLTRQYDCYTNYFTTANTVTTIEHGNILASGYFITPGDKTMRWTGPPAHMRFYGVLISSRNTSGTNQVSRANVYVNGVSKWNNTATGLTQTIGWASDCSNGEFAIPIDTNTVIRVDMNVNSTGGKASFHMICQAIID